MKTIRRFIRIMRKRNRRDGNYIGQLFNRFDDWMRPENNR